MRSAVNKMIPNKIMAPSTSRITMIRSPSPCTKTAMLEHVRLLHTQKCTLQKVFGSKQDLLFCRTLVSSVHEKFRKTLGTAFGFTSEGCMAVHAFAVT